MDRSGNRSEASLRESFARQKFLQTIGATLDRIAPGEAEITLPFRDDLVQQTGSLHAGVIATLADSACGYAALSLMPEESDVASVEFKLNLLAAATAPHFLARGKVLRTGRTLSVATADVLAGDLLVATMLATMIRR